MNWSVLERSFDVYEKISTLYENKRNVSAVRFYNLIEAAMKNQGDLTTHVNAAFHVWNQLKNDAAAGEKDTFFEFIGKYENQKISVSTIKNFLLRLAEKYGKKDLAESLYFYV